MRSSFTSLARALAAGSSGFMALAQTLFVRFLTLGLNVITGILVARHLGPVGRADQSAILLGGMLFPFLISFGIPLAVQYKIKTDPARETEFVSASVLLIIALGFCSFGIGFFVLPHLLAKYSTAIVLAAELSMMTAPLAMLYSLLCAILQARHRFNESNFTRYAMPISTLIVLIVLILAHKMTPLTSAIAYLQCPVWAAPWLWTKVRPRLTLTGFKDAARSLWSYGSRTYVSDVLGTLAAQIDQVLVIGLLSPASMGIYAVALGSARAADIFSTPVVTVLFPKASARSASDIAALTGRAFRITGALLFVTTIGLIVTMPFLLPLFYGHAFSAAVPVAQFIVVSIALNGCVYVLAQAYNAGGRPGIIAFIQLAGLATTLPAMLLLIPRYGLRGAAASLVIATSVRLLLALAGFPIILKVGIPSLFLKNEDIAYVRRSIGRTQKTAV